jgi:hypothetical protein
MKRTTLCFRSILSVSSTCSSEGKGAILRWICRPDPAEGLVRLPWRSRAGEAGPARPGPTTGGRPFRSGDCVPVHDLTHWPSLVRDQDLRPIDLSPPASPPASREKTSPDNRRCPVYRSESFSDLHGLRPKSSPCRFISATVCLGMAEGSIELAVASPSGGSGACRWFSLR